jgi:hypothetical protein
MRNNALAPRPAYGALPYRAVACHTHPQVTDVAASTQLWEWKPEVMDRAIDLHNVALRALMDEFGGHEIRNEGVRFAWNALQHSSGGGWPQQCAGRAVALGYSRHAMLSVRAQDSFTLSFHDAVDAVNFCLKARAGLTQNSAAQPWSRWPRAG